MKVRPRSGRDVNLSDGVPITDWALLKIWLATYGIHAVEL